MHLLPTPEEVVRVLRDTGAVRDGHFSYPDGLHSNEYLQVPLAMRHYQHARMMSVALSRKIRSNPELRAMIPELSIVAAGPAGLPVAYGVCEALRARQVYWAEKGGDSPMQFRPYLEQQKDEPVVMVDDILRSGSKLTEMKQLLERNGARVVAMAVVIYQPTPNTKSFGDLPFYYLAELDASYFAPGDQCQLCRRGIPADPVWT